MDTGKHKMSPSLPADDVRLTDLKEFSGVTPALDSPAFPISGRHFTVVT